MIFWRASYFTEMMIWFASSMICRSAFGQLLKEQDIFIKLIREVLRLADQGFDMADIFPSYKFLHGLGGVKKKILDVHYKVDSIVEDVINEHKKNFANHKTSDDALGGGEDLIDVLLRLMKDKSLQFPINNHNIKAIIVVSIEYYVCSYSKPFVKSLEVISEMVTHLRVVLLESHSALF